MRLAWMALLCFITITARAFAPRAACWTDGAETRLAALAEGQLHLGRVTAGGIVDLGTLPTPNLTTLAVGQWRGAPALLGAGGKTLQRFDAGRQRWVALGTAGAPIRELHPAPDHSPRALLLTGTSNDPAKNQGAVWWADWRTACRLTRVAAVKDTYRPWQLCWTQLPGEQRFAIAAYKATPMADFPHNCMFVFAWHDHTAEPRWLGSRLTRPYVDAAHANLRGDGQFRMVSVEVTRDGGHGLSVYRPIGFGYEGEWRTETVPGLERVAAFRATVLCWGRNAAGTPSAWRLLPQEDGYRLEPLPAAPPALEGVALIDPARLGGWWDGAWHVVQLPQR